MDEINAPGVKFERVGEEIGGLITDVEFTQQTEYGTRIPLYWENKKKATRAYDNLGQPNDPMMQREITVEVGVPDETGQTARRFFIRGQRMTDAYKVALAAGGAGRDGILIGGQLYGTWTGTEPSQGGGADAKTYRFRYVAPAAGQGRKPSGVKRLAGGAPAPAFSSPATTPLPPFELNMNKGPTVVPYAPGGLEPVPAQRQAFDEDPPF